MRWRPGLEKAGTQPCDIITRVGDFPIGADTSFQNALFNCVWREQREIEVYRDVGDRTFAYALSTRCHIPAAGSPNRGHTHLDGAARRVGNVRMRGKIWRAEHISARGVRMSRKPGGSPSS